MNVLGHANDADFFDAVLQILRETLFNVCREDLRAADFEDVLFMHYDDQLGCIHI